jgi:peptidyl-prolyl cis-trans isomerase D
MFDFIRTHQRLMQFILLLLILPSFVFFGVQGYSGFMGDGDAVAKIAGKPVTRQEYEAAQRERMERYRQMLGPQFDPKMFDTPEARSGLMDEVITGRVVAAEANRHNLGATDAHVNESMGEIPQIKALFGPDGKLDTARYQQLLAAQGMNHESFRARIRDDLARRQVAAALVSSTMVPKTVVENLNRLATHTRDVQELGFSPLQYAAQVKVTPEEIKQYYDAHPQEMQIPEQVSVEYLVLSPDAVAAGVPVKEEDVKAFYEANKSRYGIEEQRRASHILVKAAKDAPPAEKEAAKAKAQSLLEQARKNPNDFAKLAKANSQDEGSAPNGGDLGFFGPGMMVKPFEDAVFKMKEGDISDLVESDFGYHVIKVTGIKAGQVQTLEQVRTEVEKELRKQQAAKTFAEAAENFTNLVYEQADSLKPAADKLKLKVETASGITRTPQPGQDANLPVYKDKVREALFSTEVLKNKRNTEAIDVGNNTLVAARVVNHIPAKQRPLEEVSDAIKAQLTQKKALEVAAKNGKEKLAELQKTPSEAGFGPVKSVSRTNPAGLSPDALKAIMKADAAKLPAFVGVELGSRGYAVYRISKLTDPPAPPAAELAARAEPLIRAEAEAEAYAYLEALKKRYKVEILAPAAAPAAEGAAPAKAPAPEKKAS